MIFFITLFAALVFSLVAQEFIPALPWLYGAQVYLLPVVFFYCALAMPMAAMLVLAFATGFMWDAMTVQIVDGNVEISLGWSIILYAILGSIMSGFRPLFQRGRWEIHCLLSGVFTALILFAEYLMITFRRGEFIFPAIIWWRIAGSGLVAALLAPAVFFVLNTIAAFTGYDTRASRKVDEELP
jgi:hypothetical protein